jgi:hypothetical protein
MRYKLVLEFEFGDDGIIGFGDCDGMSDLDLIKMLVEEEGLFGCIEVTNEALAEGIKSIEAIKE